MKLQDYSSRAVIPGVEIIDLKVHKDDGGSFCELARIQAGTYSGEGAMSGIFHEIITESDLFDTLQVNFSILHPGTIKAFHLHKRQTDQFNILDKMIVVLVDLRGYSKWVEEYVDTDILHYIEKTNPTVMRLVLENQSVVVPPGIGHGICNPYNKDGRMVYFVNQHFNPQDEWRLPWDLLGSKIWEIQKG